MNREILFRGKRFGDGEWVEGYFAKYRDFQNKVYTSILQLDKDDFGDAYCCGKVPVIPETVGQYTGLTDKNEVKIFEGDIVKGTIVSAWTKREIICYIDWEINGFVSIDNNKNIHKVKFGKNIEVIGNIYDNPELLEDEE